MIRSAWPDASVATCIRSNRIDRAKSVSTHDAFVLRPYAGRVLLIWPHEQTLRASDYRRDWREIAPQLTIATIAGGHDATVTTHLTDLARIIGERLA